MSSQLVLAVDQGTTGTTVLVVDESGEIRGRGYREIAQSYPRPGWVEHDPEDIWRSVLEASAQACTAATIDPGAICAVGLTNQRETLVAWSDDGRAVAPAIVWQDRRTAANCERLAAAGHAERVRYTTGLVLDPYFSATKLAWLREHVDGAREARVGTVDSWLIARMTGGREHLTDASNASRTSLMDIRSGRWSEEMLDLFGVSGARLPQIVPSSGEIARTDPAAFGGIRAPIAGVAGDQQAALFGQACLHPGKVKATFGTGSFVLVNSGPRPAAATGGMLATVAWLREGNLEYAAEGAVFVTGASLQWLRDQVGLIRDAAEAGPLCESVPDTGDVYLVPAFAGLGAPYWDPYARGALVGLTRGTGRAHIVRAAVEAMGYQVAEVISAMNDGLAAPVLEVRVDGGACVMDFLCQWQADLAGLPVLRPRQVESTALGAAFLAARGGGVWAADAQVSAAWRLDRRFEPRMSRDEAATRMQRWREAVARSRDWADA